MSLSISELCIETWVQGEPDPVTDLMGAVVLVEVIQVNCPGCFLYALPEIIRLHEEYKSKGLFVFILATAFEDHDKNTLQNLRNLVDHGLVIGETYKALHQSGLLVDDRLGWQLPFPVAMDQVVEDTVPVTADRVLSYAHQVLPDFPQYADQQKNNVLQQVKSYLEQKTKRAETFERFSLRGTPSSILFDRTGNLSDVSFGQVEHLQSLIEKLL